MATFGHLVDYTEVLEKARIGGSGMKASHGQKSCCKEEDANCHTCVVLSWTEIKGKGFS